MAKRTEPKGGDRVIWERTDGVKFLGTVRRVSLHEVDVELDKNLYGLFGDGPSELTGLKNYETKVRQFQELRNTVLKNREIRERL